MGAFDWADAPALARGGLALAREIGDDAVAVAIKHAQGVLAGCRGRNAAARELLEECARAAGRLPEAGEPLFWAMHISPVVVPAAPGRPRRAASSRTRFCLFRTVGRRAGTGYVLVQHRRDAGAPTATTHAARERARARARAVPRARRRRPATASRSTRSATSRARPASSRSGRRRFEEALAMRRAARRPARDRDDAHPAWACSRSPPASEERGARCWPRRWRYLRAHRRRPGTAGHPAEPRRVRARRRATRSGPRAVRASRRASHAAQGLERHRGWADAELAEAAIALGDLERARGGAARGAIDASSAAGTAAALALRAQRSSSSLAAPATPIEPLMSGC